MTVFILKSKRRVRLFGLPQFALSKETAITRTETVKKRYTILFKFKRLIVIYVPRFVVCLFGVFRPTQEFFSHLET